MQLTGHTEVANHKSYLIVLLRVSAKAATFKESIYYVLAFSFSVK